MQSIKIGTIANCDILQKLSLDKALVRLGDQEMILQFNRFVANDKKVKVQIMDIRENTVYARLLTNELSTEDLISRYNLQGHSSTTEFNTAMTTLRMLNLPIDEKNIKKLIMLFKATRDMDLSAAMLVKGVSFSQIEDMLEIIGRFDLKKTLESLEKIIMKNLKQAENLFGKGDLFNGLTLERLFKLSEFLGFFAPDFENRLLKEIKELAGHMKFRLLRLKKALMDKGTHNSDLDSLLVLMDYNNLRSVVTDQYAAYFYSLFWKDEEEWRSAEFAVRVDKTGNDYFLDLTTEFDNLGLIAMLVNYNPSEGDFHLRVGTASQPIMDYLKKNLSFKDSEKVSLNFFILGAETGSGAEKLKRIDLTV